MIESELRKTGINSIGDLPWGTHFSLFYETKQDLLDILAPYFRAGLETNELCLWVVSPPLKKEEAYGALQKAIPDLDRYQAVGSIEILGGEGWYLEDGTFESRRIISSWQEKREQALAHGYAGLRVSGDTLWLKLRNRQDYCLYETDLTEAVSPQRLLVLCTFSLTESTARDILDVLRFHDRAIVKREGSWQVVETPELKQAKQELARLNGQLEQRVVQRTGELVAANEDLRGEIAERKRAEVGEREQRTLAEALRDTAEALNSTLDFREVVDRMLENAGRVMPHDTSTLMLLEGDKLRIEGHRGYTERGLKEWVESLQIASEKHPVFQRMVETGKPVVISNPSTSPFLDIFREILTDFPDDLLKIRSYITTPIFFQGKVIGMLSLQSFTPNFFNDYDTGRLQTFADQAAIALQNARLLQEVNTARNRLQALSEQLLVAQEAERREIARELHDQIGQVLTAVSANLRAIDPSTGSAELAERLEESLDLVDEAISQIRDLSLDLRPSMLDDFGLVPALEWYIDRLAQRSGLQSEFVAPAPEVRLRSTIETACFRVAQIALTNVARHAHAKKIYVEFSNNQSWLELVIRDDGVGFDVQAALERASRGATLGLLSMQERVRLARGTLDITSVSGRGTEIRARFPVKE